MKRSAWSCISLLGVLIFSAGHPAFAEIYRFTDANGETHYTNDATAVPREYRDNTEVESETIIYGNDAYYDNSDQSTPATGGDDENLDQPQGNLGEVGDLKAQEAAFDREFKQLQEERERLNKAMQEAKTRDEVDEINAQTEEFNMRYKDWHQRRKAFKQKVKDYNEQVRQEMEQQLEQYKAKQASPEEDIQ